LTALDANGRCQRLRILCHNSAAFSIFEPAADLGSLEIVEKAPGRYLAIQGKAPIVHVEQLGAEIDRAAVCRTILATGIRAHGKHADN
jgi:hypothetical protein